MSDNSPPAPEYELDDTKIKQDTADDGHVVDVSAAINEGIEIEVDEADNRRVLRKIDWHLMPLMCLVYGLQFVSGGGCMHEPW
jgi:ACS family allantoate permease-like MFS transporter